MHFGPFWIYERSLQFIVRHIANLSTKDTKIEQRAFYRYMTLTEAKKIGHPELGISLKYST